jgi:type IV secretion system protein VirB5
MNLKHILATCALALGFTASPAHAGIPVVDGPHIGESIMEQVEIIMQWAAQYEQMIEQIEALEAQLDQLEETHESITGNRGYGGYGEGSAESRAYDYAPVKYEDFLSGNVPASSDGGATWETIYKENQRYDITEEENYDEDDEANQLFLKGGKYAAIDSATSQRAYNESVQRVKTLQALAAKINETDDQKAILELQARIMAEHALIQNESNRLTALAMAQQAQEKLAAQQATEMIIRSTRATPTAAK